MSAASELQTLGYDSVRLAAEPDLAAAEAWLRFAEEEQLNCLDRLYLRMACCYGDDADFADAPDKATGEKALKAILKGDQTVCGTAEKPTAEAVCPTDPSEKRMGCFAHSYEMQMAYLRKAVALNSKYLADYAFALQSSDWNQAVALLEQGADAGDPECMADLSYRLSYGANGEILFSPAALLTLVFAILAFLNCFVPAELFTPSAALLTSFIDVISKQIFPLRLLVALILLGLVFFSVYVVFFIASLIQGALILLLVPRFRAWAREAWAAGDCKLLWEIFYSLFRQITA